MCGAGPTASGCTRPAPDPQRQVHALPPIHAVVAARLLLAAVGLRLEPDRVDALVRALAAGLILDLASIAKSFSCSVPFGSCRQSSPQTAPQVLGLPAAVRAHRHVAVRAAGQLRHLEGKPGRARCTDRCGRPACQPSPARSAGSASRDRYRIHGTVRTRCRPECRPLPASSPSPACPPGPARRRARTEAREQPPWSGRSHPAARRPARCRRRAAAVPAAARCARQP
jgi:hypothetical protein